MIKLIAFDLDGTLTQHRTPIGPECEEILLALKEKYKLLMVGAGACRRIFEQMKHFPIDIVGNYGMQTALYNYETKDIDVKNEPILEADKELCEQKVTFLRQKHGFCEFRGKMWNITPRDVLPFPFWEQRQK